MGQLGHKLWHSTRERQTLRDSHSGTPATSLSSLLLVHNGFLNYLPFSPPEIHIPVPCPQQPAQGAQRKTTGGHKADSSCLFSASCPHPRSLALGFQPQKQTAGQPLLRGLCLWWFFLRIISLQISEQLAGSHLLLTELANLISNPRKDLGKLEDKLCGILG